jgi:signal peptidase I
MLSLLARYQKEMRSAAQFCFAVLVVTALIINFVGRVSIVQGGSMEPGIVTGERIIVNLLVYDFNRPRRGDIIIFRNPRDTSKDYIKRVIALAGETIEIKGGVTYINDHELPEPYVTLRDFTDLPICRIPPNCLWVMGDNRANSEDSRRWGALPLPLVRGKASVVFWPPERLTVYP